MLFYYYIGIISVISAILFLLDKQLAKKHKTRIPEKILHTFELLGSVFVIIPLMYIIHHKNKKFGYYWITYAILLLWIIGILIIRKFGILIN